MLRRVDSVEIGWEKKGVLRRKGHITVKIGRKRLQVAESRITFADYLALQDRQRNQPVLICGYGGRNYWQFQDRFYSENDSLRADQVHALLVTRQQREQRRIDLAQATVSAGRLPTTRARTAIPDDVKQYVWARDHGRCVECGSTSELQFDHVIPISMGGGPDANNLQLLCGPCNRRKSGGLTMRA